MASIDPMMTLAKKKLGFLLPSFISKGFHQYSPRPVSVKTYKCNLTHQPPLISVVVPSYNQGRFLERTIKSVLEQEYPRIELIVVDGGSTDESVSILEKYDSKIHWWCSEPDSGQTHAINKGFLKASGDILAWLNADDCYIANSFALVANFMNERPDVDVVYSHRLLIDEYDQEIGRWILPPHSDKILSWADYIPQETLFWRRAIWGKVGRSLDASFQFAMDWDLLLRFRGANAKMERLPVYLGLFRIHPQQKTSSQFDQIGIKEIQQLRQRNLGYTPSKLQCVCGVLGYLLMGRFFEILPVKAKMKAFSTEAM